MLETDNNYAAAYNHQNYKGIYQHSLKSNRQEILNYLGRDTLGPETKNFYSHNIPLYMETFLARPENR